MPIESMSLSPITLSLLFQSLVVCIITADELLERKIAPGYAKYPSEVAQDLIENFGVYWEVAQANPLEQERLLNLMLVRGWVEGDDVVRLCLRPNPEITAGLDTKRPTEVSVDLDSYRSGHDGGTVHWLRGSYWKIQAVSRHFNPSRDLVINLLSATRSD
jgi:hypothetical protein